MSTLPGQSTFVPFETPGIYRTNHKNHKNFDPNDGIRPFAEKPANFTLDEDEIFKLLDSYKSFETTDGQVIRNLPKFDDLSACNVSSEKEMDLWKDEVRRLVKVATSASPVHLADFDNAFGKADFEGYTRLHKLATQLNQALAVCCHDNELILIEHCPAVANFNLYEEAHKRLLREFDQDDMKDRYERSLRLDKNNDRCFHALVDYITGSLVRVLIRTMDGESWTHNCIATVAKTAAKLKVLLFNIAEAASRSLGGTNDVRRRMEVRNKIYAMFGDSGGGQGQGKDDSPSQKQHEALQDTETDVGRAYFQRMDTFHSQITLLLRVLIADLVGNEHSGLAVDIFDTSVLVYETGKKETLTLFCGERDGSVGATCHPGEIRCAGAAIDICLEVWEALARVHKSNELTDHTLFHFKYTGMDAKGVLAPHARRGTLYLSSLASVVTAFVPYLMICGPFVSHIETFTTTATFVAESTKPIRPFIETRFLATFMVKTSAYEAKKSSFISDPDVYTVSSCDMAQKKALAEGVMTGTFRGNNVKDKHLRDDREKASKLFEDGMSRLEMWLYDENSITIPYRSYCWGTLAICAILIGGGLAIGLSVQNRIIGVDPFQLASFSWLMAGFIVVFAKSIRVENWPWRDFFKGKVVCRSISEVTAVTGMDTQLLLSLLLRVEPRMNLKKRGAFSTIFTRLAPDGFLIDEPINTAAGMDGGTIFVKVSSSLGPALVSVTARNKSPWNSVSPVGQIEDGAKVICRDLMVPGSRRTKGETVPMFALCRNSLQWSRVLGVYEREAVYN